MDKENGEQQYKGDQSADNDGKKSPMLKSMFVKQS